MNCPICRRKSDPAFRPFCSRRCADIDLGKWLSGQYAIPSHAPEDMEAAAEEIENIGDGKDEPH
jgi:endogenous inhibitor of DNA gyrase (YacG/DUF329 family)